MVIELYISLYMMLSWAVYIEMLSLYDHLLIDEQV